MPELNDAADEAMGIIYGSEDYLSLISGKYKQVGYLKIDNSLHFLVMTAMQQCPLLFSFTAK